MIEVEADAGVLTELGSDGVLTVIVPLSIRRRGGRRRIVTPSGEGWAPRQPRIDSTIVKALARAFRWRRLLETGVYSSSEELAAAERINPSYVSRVLRLTLLAPDLVEALLEGQAPTITLACLFKPFPTVWGEQRAALTVLVQTSA